ncbi:MAG TPA: flagellar biosynthetic protein FliO [Alphaproteobacteria bacterium]|nr:flagellar biosynthetic protein FliO [Alphaproteobacteria bacterium]
MDSIQYLRFLAALAFVLALIAVIAWAARRWGLLGAVAARGRGQARRLELVEAMALDAKRRLVLVRRDGVEHLVLLGINGDLLIESGIAGAVTSSPPARPGSLPDRTP